MGPLGFTEILFILLLALLLFGPRRLPELGRTLGRGLAEFRRASTDLRATIEDEIQSVEREVNTEPEAPRSPSISPPSPPQAAKTPRDS
ncbi:MAG: twin-arginine translocase TatA/TatE family subunit [Terriglobia bacterium]